MGRLYETAADLRNEAVAIATLCAALGCEAVKLPLMARADHMLISDGEARTVVEFKRRRTRRRAYDTYMVSKGKHDALLGWTDKGFKAALLVQWADELAYVMLPVEHEVSEGGRRDRGDPRDIEEVVHIPVEHFKTVMYGGAK